MKNKLFLMVLFLACTYMVNAQNITTEIDSVEFVAGYMSFNPVINSYEITDAEHEWIHNNRPDWVLKYFPEILEKYDCDLNTKFKYATSLYLLGKHKYLCRLWKKFGYLLEFMDGDRNEKYPMNEIWQLLDYYKIDPHKLKGCDAILSF